MDQKMWEELHYLRSQEILIEVEHVKVHRTEKERQERVLFSKRVKKCTQLLQYAASFHCLGGMERL